MMSVTDWGICVPVGWGDNMCVGVGSEVALEACAGWSLHAQERP
jgi:hypothetical protein